MLWFIVLSLLLISIGITVYAGEVHMLNIQHCQLQRFRREYNRSRCGLPVNVINNEAFMSDISSVKLTVCPERTSKKEDVLSYSIMK